MSVLDNNNANIKHITNNIQDWLYNVYNKSKNSFGKSSPFGQIINTIGEFFKLLFVYTEDIAVESNIYTATKERSIYGLARIAGHNPTRALSAEGSVILYIKSTYNNENDIKYINIPNKIALNCFDNNILYFLDFNTHEDFIKINTSKRELIKAKIIQGVNKKYTTTSYGGKLQSYTFGNKESIDHDKIKVYVNGVRYSIVESLWDMLPQQHSCLIKTGISGGVDVYFGTGEFGSIPFEGSTIEIEYIETVGFDGNIPSKDNVLFLFNEDGYDENGDILDLNNILDIEIDKNIMMGADAESLEVTKMLAPKSSKSFVLANPSNYKQFLAKFDYTDVTINIKDEDNDFISDDNIIYINLVPNIKSRVRDPLEYFEIDKDFFNISNDEKDAILQHINDSGQQLISTELEINGPIIKQYVLNIVVDTFDNYDRNIIREKIYNDVATYFINNKRRDKIPRSDIIALLENIEGIDSVNLNFTSKFIEDQYINNIQNNTDDKIIFDIDSFGDIIIGYNELPIIRGGWDNRNNNTFEDGLFDKKLSSVNIIFNK